MRYDVSDPGDGDYGYDGGDDDDDGDGVATTIVATAASTAIAVVLAIAALPSFSNDDDANATASTTSKPTSKRKRLDPCRDTDIFDLASLSSWCSKDGSSRAARLSKRIRRLKRVDDDDDATHDDDAIEDDVERALVDFLDGRALGDSTDEELLPRVRSVLRRCDVPVVRSGDGMRLDGSYVVAGKLNIEALERESRVCEPLRLAFRRSASASSSSSSDPWTRTSTILRHARYDTGYGGVAKTTKRGIAVVPLARVLRYYEDDAAFVCAPDRDRFIAVGDATRRFGRVGRRRGDDDDDRGVVLRCDDVALAVYEHGSSTREIFVIDASLGRVVAYVDVREGEYVDANGETRRAPCFVKMTIDCQPNGASTECSVLRDVTMPNFPLELSRGVRAIREAGTRYALSRDGSVRVFADANDSLNDAPPKERTVDLLGTAVRFVFRDDQWYRADADADADAD